MKSFLIFLGGFFAGLIVSFFIFFFISYNIYSDSSKVKTQVQQVEVKGKKGNVTLYTNMPKDSVQILVGKPDEINLNQIGNTYFEVWGYKLKNNYVSDLKIDFEDGRLKGIRQN